MTLSWRDPESGEWLPVGPDVQIPDPVRTEAEPRSYRIVPAGDFTVSIPFDGDGAETLLAAAEAGVASLAVEWVRSHSCDVCGSLIERGQEAGMVDPYDGAPGAPVPRPLCWPCLLWVLPFDSWDAWPPECPLTTGAVNQSRRGPDAEWEDTPPGLGHRPWDEALHFSAAHQAAQDGSCRDGIESAMDGYEAARRQRLLEAYGGRGFAPNNPAAERVGRHEENSRMATPEERASVRRWQVGWRSYVPPLPDAWSAEPVEPACATSAEDAPEESPEG